MPEALGRHEPRLRPRRGDRGAVLPADRFITLVVDHEQGRASRHAARNLAHVQICPPIPNAALTAGSNEVYGLGSQREDAHKWGDPRRRIGGGGEKDESLSLESPRQRQRRAAAAEGMRNHRVRTLVTTLMSDHSGERARE